MKLALALTLLAGCGSSSAMSPGDGDLARDDGAPVRVGCTERYGAALDTPFGRLDGELIAILDPGQRRCHADRDHVHLQVRANNAVYDIAVNVSSNTGGSVLYEAIDHPLYGPPWAEGWHGDVTLDYPTVGLRSMDFAPVPTAKLASTIEAELSTANHVSVFASSYTDGSGAHLVHRNGDGNDGAIVVRPLSAVAHVLAFHFAGQDF
ncbi:MAG: hypothetical protein ABI321_23760 [Polyangia bacterium]